MRILCFLLLLVVLVSCGTSPDMKPTTAPAVYQDVSYEQDYSVKYFPIDTTLQLKKVATDRNGNVQVLTDKGLLKPFSGKLLHPGKLVKETYYRPLADKHVQGLSSLQRQFVYLDNKAVLSNAWAGKVYQKHTLKNATLLAGGKNFDFLISDGRTFQYSQESGVVWEDLAGDNVLDIRFDEARNQFWALAEHAVFVFTPHDLKMRKVWQGQELRV